MEYKTHTQPTPIDFINQYNIARYIHINHNIFVNHVFHILPIASVGKITIINIKRYKYIIYLPINTL